MPAARCFAIAQAGPPRGARMLQRVPPAAGPAARSLKPSKRAGHSSVLNERPPPGFPFRPAPFLLSAFALCSGSCRCGGCSGCCCCCCCLPRLPPRVRAGGGGAPPSLSDPAASASGCASGAPPCGARGEGSNGAGGVRTAGGADAGGAEPIVQQSGRTSRWKLSNQGRGGGGSPAVSNLV